MWTILQVPCLNVPGFAGVNGMPIGLTVVGPRYSDLHVLHTGKAMGELFATKGGFESKLF
jgi:Asp-tRNA(Asn)/Glu-tRNA(Gln) amidotransferase A subunit family amidase